MQAATLQAAKEVPPPGDESDDGAVTTEPTVDGVVGTS